MPRCQRKERSWHCSKVLPRARDKLQTSGLGLAKECGDLAERVVEGVAEDRKPTHFHPSGTIKAWMGTTHFLTRRLNQTVR